MNELRKIYTLTVLPEKDPCRGARTWAWFSTKPKAEESLTSNPEWFLEDGYYKWILLEEVKEGGDIEPAQHWYSAKFEGDGKYTIAPIDVPEWAKLSVSFSIG